jgi:hypothetical protein
LLAHKFLNFLAQAIFSAREAKIHGLQSRFGSRLSHLYPTKKDLFNH